MDEIIIELKSKTLLLTTTPALNKKINWEGFFSVGCYFVFPIKGCLFPCSLFISYACFATELNQVLFLYQPVYPISPSIALPINVIYLPLSLEDKDRPCKPAFSFLVLSTFIYTFILIDLVESVREVSQLELFK